MWIAVFGPPGRLLELIAVADSLKPTARAAVQQLRRIGITNVLLTHDNQRTATAVAAQLRIERVLAAVLPAEKGRRGATASSAGQTYRHGRRWHQ